MQIVIFEDPLAKELRPVTLARPAFGISMCGTNLYNLMRSRGFKVSYILRRYLQDIYEEEFPNHPITEESLLFINALTPPVYSIVQRMLDFTKKGESFIAKAGSRVTAAFFPKLRFELKNFDEYSLANFLQSQEHELVEDAFPLINYPFDIIRYNKQYFGENLEELSKNYKQESCDVFVGKNVNVHPTVCMDTEEGAIIIDDNAGVGPFVYLKGPLYVGRNCRIIERTSIKEMCHISHTCKVGGEVECSIMEPYSNKQHHGFLGHSWIGSWVNMGAGTSNSDLKNTYGEIAIEYQGKKVSTNMQFLGSIIGDYSKTAVNTGIFTGKIIGVASYVYGFVTTNVSSFCNYARTFSQITEHYLPAVIRTQRRMFIRRSIEQRRMHIKLLEDIYEVTRDERIMSTNPLSL